MKSFFVDVIRYSAAWRQLRHPGVIGWIFILSSACAASLHGQSADVGGAHSAQRIVHKAPCNVDCTTQAKSVLASRVKAESLAGSVSIDSTDADGWRIASTLVLPSGYGLTSDDTHVLEGAHPTTAVLTMECRFTGQIRHGKISFAYQDWKYSQGGMARVNADQSRSMHDDMEHAGRMFESRVFSGMHTKEEAPAR